MPHLPDEALTDEQKNADEEILPNLHKVAKYSNISLNDVLELPCDLYMALLRDAVIEELERTEEGREYLDKCKRLSNTEVDVDGLINLRGEMMNGKS